MNPWQLLNEVKYVSQDSLEAQARVPEGSAWFTGHFPGEPILPGIAMVHMVYTAIKEDGRAKGEEIDMISLRRVRFTQPVRPGEKLDIHLTREVHAGETVYVFKVNVNENVVCSGMIAVTCSATDKKLN